MAVIKKKIGGRFYAYISEREGGRVVHRYIGPAGDPAVQKKLAVYARDNALPERFRTLFWDTRLESINLKRNATYIIARVLDLGGLDALNWVQLVYPVRKILGVLASSRALSEKSRNFWSLWFGGENT